LSLRPNSCRADMTSPRNRFLSSLVSCAQRCRVSVARSASALLGARIHPLDIPARRRAASRPQPGRARQRSPTHRAQPHTQGLLTVKVDDNRKRTTRFSCLRLPSETSHPRRILPSSSASRARSSTSGSAARNFFHSGRSTRGTVCPTVSQIGLLVLTTKSPLVAAAADACPPGGTMPVCPRATSKGAAAAPGRACRATPAALGGVCQHGGPCQRLTQIARAHKQGSQGCMALSATLPGRMNRTGLPLRSIVRDLHLTVHGPGPASMDTSACPSSLRWGAFGIGDRAPLPQGVRPPRQPRRLAPSSPRASRQSLAEGGWR